MGKISNRRKKNRKQLIIGAIAIVLVVFAFTQYESWKENSSKVFGHFVNPDGNKTQRYSFEIAHTPAQRARGLMFRKTMHPDEGMIFVFPYSEKQVFWMRNTFVSLDMIFLDEKFKVVGLLENVPINNEEKRSVDRESLYVVELVAGSAESKGIQVGSTLSLERKLPDAE